MQILFTNIKHNFFQKVAFYTYQTLFLGQLFAKHNFLGLKVEPNGYLKLKEKRDNIKHTRNATLKISVVLYPKKKKTPWFGNSL